MRIPASFHANIQITMDHVVMHCTIAATLQVRWFVDLFSETFLPGLFALLRADSDEALQAAQTSLRQR